MPGSGALRLLPGSRPGEGLGVRYVLRVCNDPALAPVDVQARVSLLGWTGYGFAVEVYDSQHQVLLAVIRLFIEPYNQRLLCVLLSTVVLGGTLGLRFCGSEVHPGDAMNQQRSKSSETHKTHKHTTNK